MRIPEIDAYLEEKGIRYRTAYVNKRGPQARVKLFDVTRKMFREVVLPAMEELAARDNCEVRVVMERYGKTTEERVIFVIEGVESELPDYQITWDTSRAASKTFTGAARSLLRRKGR
jgi:hypothetical protein